MAAMAAMDGGPRIKQRWILIDVMITPLYEYSHSLNFETHLFFYFLFVCACGIVTWHN